jgi:cell division protein FtsW (lipid II flippase)
LVYWSISTLNEVIELEAVSRILLSRRTTIQGLLISLVALFLGLYATALTISPAIRFQTGDYSFRWEQWLGYIVWLGVFIAIQFQTKKHLPKADPFLIPVVAAVSGIGLLTIWRLMPTFGARQTLWLAIAAAVLIAGLQIPSHLAFLRRYKYLWLTSGLFLTALTLSFGTNPGIATGPRLWLGCCGVYFQPSEPLKLLLIVYLAAYLADRLPLTNKLLPLLVPTLIMTGFTLLLLIAQRDLGTATIFLYLYTTILYVATGRKRIVLVSLLILILSGTVGYLTIDIVRVRVETWINPWLDPSGNSYQIIQSLIAVANGGLLGRGPGLGSPSFVPIHHSDFIFVAIAEEMGLAGSLALLISFGLIISRGMIIALRSSDGFSRYLAAGLTAYLVGQSVLIIGGNLRMLPLTGVTLPFVAYGGSSLLTAFISLLILLHISHHAETKPILLNNWQPYLRLSIILFTALVILSLFAGWWAYFQSKNLLARTDNPRRALSDRYVLRGSILDRHHTPLVTTSGAPGSYLREYLHPAFTPIVGYSHAVYGQTGLEAALDGYLRGLEGNPEESVWWNNLLYGQPPSGLDIRLSVDINLQYLVHDLLADKVAALVLLNASNGEVLALASYPTFYPNKLDELWAELITDPRSPLLNRATQGRYPPGNALGPLLLAAAYSAEGLPTLPEPLSYEYENYSLDCAILPIQPSWGNSISGGCPAAQLALGQYLGVDELLPYLVALGLDEQVPFELTTTRPSVPHTLTNPEGVYLGLADLQFSPLHMAQAVATLSSGGIRSVPQLAMAYKTPDLVWFKISAPQEPVRILDEEVVAAAASSIAVVDQSIWQSVAVVPTGFTSEVTWYLAGTLPGWDGKPLTLVLLLEENNPLEAKLIGRSILKAAITP